MAEIDRIMQALKAADAAGDTAAATRLAQMAREAQSGESELAGGSQDIGWADVPGMALKNFLPSAGNVVKDTVTPLMHPVETAKALGNLAVGTGQKFSPQMDMQTDDLVQLRSNLGMKPWDAADPTMAVPNKEQYPEAVGEFVSDRYLKSGALKNTLANDPAGVMADLSAVISGGAGLAARAPGVAGRVANVTGKIGRAIDPVNIAAKGAALAGKKVLNPMASAILGNATGAGPAAVKEAARAGKEGGRTGAAFTDQMRGAAPIEDVVTDAKTALDRMKQDRGAHYRSGMVDVSNDRTIIDFKPIDDALDKVSEVGTFKGEVIKPAAVDAMNEIRAEIERWKSLDPAEFHTAEGLDALKQKIRSVGDGYDPITQKQARIIVDQTYNAIKSEIVKQAPVYADVMKGYESASDLIHDIEKTLSVSPKANIDTTIRKLQSVMRSNANTNYGRRADLAGKLAESGAPNLMPRLAGQALSSPIPRGIQGGVAIPTALTLAGTQPWLVPLMAGTSPRLVGEAAYYAGRAASVPSKMADALRSVGLTPRGVAAGGFQAGRLEDDMQPRPMQSYQPRSMNNALGAK